ncbi:MAG TPA: glucose 1-dehydrogenase [Pseudolabrys sp.]|nr:glucose 1-dehydrogenase [Pseudolabrys sp.]
MRALTVQPGVAHSLKLDDVAEPPASDGELKVRALALGVCGTDREIVDGDLGSAPPASKRLILGHESLGEVIEAPRGCGFKTGDLVVGIVRRPDPVPCPACAAGEWDMCENGRYTERGIKDRHGYGAEYFRVEPDFAVKIEPALGALGVLVEPTSVVAKAWDHIERIGARAPFWKPRTLLVTGAGPIGLLGALLGVQRGLDVHVFDRVNTGRKPELTRALGATYHDGNIDQLEPDIVLECTGAPTVVLKSIHRIGHNGIVCLTGMSPGVHAVDFDVSGFNAAMVLRNQLVFGTVNANREHFRKAVEALSRADPKWLGGVISRRVPLEQAADAVAHRPDDIKVVIDFAS